MRYFMKKRQKIFTLIGVNFLLLGSFASFVKDPDTSVIAASSTSKLSLSHNSYVYNKNGKRLKKSKASKTYFKQGEEVKGAEAVQPIEPDTKQFYLLEDDNYNQSWLPYTKIHGQYYYKISSGSYIKATNVGLINSKLLYTAKATVKVRNSKKNKSFTIGNGKDKTKIVRGRKYQVDALTAIFDKPNSSTKYRISGTTDAFLPAEEVKVRPQHNLKIYTKYTYISFNQKTGTYDARGAAKPTNDLRSTFAGNDLYPVEELTYIWIPSENKAELFYLLRDSWNKPDFFTFSNYLNTASAGLIYVKAANADYLSGPYLKPDNTPEQAQADAKTATTSDKQSLQNLIDQENISSYQNPSSGRICDRRFNYALEFAKAVNSSDNATIAEVKKATAILTKTQADVLNCSESQEAADKILNQTTPYVYERQY